MKLLVIFVSIILSLAVAYVFTVSSMQTGVELTDFSKHLKAEQKREESSVKSIAEKQMSLRSDIAPGVERGHGSLHQSSSQEQASIINESKNTLEESYDAFALSPEAETVQSIEDAEMIVGESFSEAPEGNFDGYSPTIDMAIASEIKVETSNMKGAEPH